MPDNELVAKRHSNRAGPSGPNTNHQVCEWYPDIQPFNVEITPEKIEEAPGKLTPGFGDAHAVCGEVRFKITCPKNPKHHDRTAAYNCHRAACPVCWPGWAARAAQEAAARVDGYRTATATPFKARHISISPPPGLITDGDHNADRSLSRLYDKARPVLTLLGVTAAAAIPHPYRLKPDRKEAAQDAAALAGCNRYEWALSQPHWSDLVNFSPHMHIVAYGPLMDAEEFEKVSGGWTYRNHDGDGDDGRTGDDLTQTLYYLLTHAWVRGNHKIVRYFKGMSTRQLKCTDIGFDLKTEPCKVCQCDCVKTPPDIVWADGTVHAFYQNLENAPTYTVKVRLYLYEVRTRTTAAPGRVPGRSAQSLLIWGPAGPPVVRS
jgi:hypothetical protein